jgi:hypothetical protein
MSKTGSALSWTLSLCLGLSATLNASERQESSAGLFGDLARMATERPTPEEFEKRFPELWLVLPGDIVERSACSPYRRFIARVDAEGRITGGLVE